MPTRNPVHYNSGTTLNYSISKNQLSFGVNNVDYGQTSKTGWYANSILYGYLITSDSYSQGVTSEQNAYPIFWGNSATTISGITSLINGLPARYGQTEFTDIETAISWLEGESIYGIQNRTYENIATSGLTLLYDVGATLSYPIVNNIIYDLGPSNVNGTLQNSPTFVDSEGGYLDFNENDSQYISFTDLGTLSNFTVGCWFKLNQSISGATFPTLVTNEYGGGSNLNFVLGQLPTWDGEISGGFFDGAWKKTDGFVPVVGEWYYVVLTYDGSNLRLYRNGILFSEVAESGSAISSGLGGYIGRNWDVSQYLDGGVSVVQIYDRAISYLEVYQNMLAQADRYSVPVPDLTFSGDSVMFIDSNKSIYKYDPNTNLVTYLYNTNIPGQVLDISVTSNLIFINDSLGNIYEYTYTQSPFSATLSQTYSFVNYIGSGMTAINNNTLLIASDNVYRINLSNSQVDMIFSLSSTCVNCVTNGDILYNSTLNEYALSYINTGTSVSYATVFDASGNTITTLDLQLFTGPQYTDILNIEGLYVYNRQIYGMTYNLYLFNLQFSMLSVSGESEPINKSDEKIVGCSSISSVPSWEELPPYFEYE
jgi:hypothetical protein